MQSTKIDINFPIAAIKTENSFLFLKKNCKKIYIRQLLPPFYRYTKQRPGYIKQQKQQVNNKHNKNFLKPIPCHRMGTALKIYLKFPPNADLRQSLCLQTQKQT